MEDLFYNNNINYDEKIKNFINYKENLIFSNLVYNKPIRKKDGYYSTVKLNNNNIIISTPYLKIYKNLFYKDDTCFIEVELGKNDKDFFIFLNQLEEHNLKIVYENSNDWFGSEIPLHKVEEFQQPLIRLSNDIIPKMKIYIPIINNEPIINKLDEDERISLLIEFEGIKFLKQQFTSIWKLVKIKYEHGEYEFNDKNIFDDSDILSSFNSIENIEKINDNTNLEDVETISINESIYNNDNNEENNLINVSNEELKNDFSKNKNKNKSKKKKLIFSTREKILK